MYFSLTLLPSPSQQKFSSPGDTDVSYPIPIDHCISQQQQVAVHLYDT